MFQSKRIRQNIVLGLFSVLVILGIYFSMASKDATYRLSMATAYSSLALIGCSLMLGPWNVFRNRSNPINSNFRRDVGIWGGVIGIIHVVIGLQVHMGGKFWLYFLPKKPQFIPFRYDLFGFANYTGLGSMLILIILLVLSNNRSLRKWGTQKWKSLQRWNYVNFLLIMLHGVAYQLIEKRFAVWVATFLIMIILVVTIQAIGFFKIRGSMREVVS